MNDVATSPDLQATVTVNGRPEPLGEGTVTVAELIAARGIVGGLGVAVAVNGAVVPRAAWAQTRLAAGDTVEIVQAKQGG